MLATVIALFVAWLLSPQSAAKPPSTSMNADVDRLVQAAEKLTGEWPSQAPPPIPEVSLVARHGPRVAPLLTTLLSDGSSVERDRTRWKVQQQAALALCLVYSEPRHCGRTYCDGDSPERIGRVKEGWLTRIASAARMDALPARELLDRFKQERVFWRQFEIGQALAARGDRHAIRELEGLLTHDDRHLRGNVAFVLARLGDPRGLDAIARMLADRSPRAPAQEITRSRWSLEAQIREDRYYAAHLLGDLKDPRGVPLLIPLLNDKDLDSIVPWSLAEIGDRRAISPLMQVLERDDPSMRVLAIRALEKLNAGEALTRLQGLLRDTRRSNSGDLVTVGEAARRAIAVIAPAAGNVTSSSGAPCRTWPQPTARQLGRPACRPGRHRVRRARRENPDRGPTRRAAHPQAPVHPALLLQA